MTSTNPDRNCPLCPRLVAFRQKARAKNPDWHNAPVPSFGEATARLLIVGLAPGMQGANRSGRPFTGDYAGDLLYETLQAYGFSSGTYDERPDDGLTLQDAKITNAVRCVPPENKPVGAEITSCRPYLIATMEEMPRLKAVLALGRIAHESLLRTLEQPLARFPFKHGAAHRIGKLTLFDSYHCSRYNTNTRRLTPAMLQSVFSDIREMLG